MLSAVAPPVGLPNPTVGHDSSGFKAIWIWQSRPSEVKTRIALHRFSQIFSVKK